MCETCDHDDGLDDEADAVDAVREFLLERHEPDEPIKLPAVGDEIPLLAKDGTVLATSRVTAVDEQTGEISAVPVWIAPDEVWREHAVESAQPVVGSPAPFGPTRQELDGAIDLEVEQ